MLICIFWIYINIFDSIIKYQSQYNQLYKIMLLCFSSSSSNNNNMSSRELHLVYTFF